MFATGAARAGVLALCALLGACGAPPRQRPAPGSAPQPAVHAPAPPSASPPAPRAPAPPMPPQPSSAPVAAGAYRIDAARSRLLVLVRRAGPMAALGHNHVLANRAVSGWAHWDGVPERAAFELELPAAAFSVDEAPLRAAAGADFAENVDEEARNGTRANLLGPAVLDAGEHPTIRVRSERIEVVGGELKATVRVEVAGHESRHVVPLRLDGRPDTLDGHVSVDLEQSTLGLTPFSVFMGALRVADTLRVELDVTAVAAR